MADKRTELPGVGATNFERRVRETLMTYLGRLGDPLDRGLTVRDLLSAGLISWNSGTGTVTAPPGDGGGGTNPGDPGYEPDYTPPPTPTGFIVTPGITFFLVEHDTASYVAGHGHLRTRLYGKIRQRDDPLPVFADAAEIAQFGGKVYAHPTNPATTWHLWIKWESKDGVLSTDPAGGVNGVEVTTGQDVQLLLDALTGQITTSQLFYDLGSRIALIDASVDVAGSVNARIAPVSAIASVKNRTYYSDTPPTDGLILGDLWFDTDDSNKAYRWDGASWVAIDDARISQLVTDVQDEVQQRIDGDLAEARRRSALYAASYAGVGNSYKYFVQEAEPTATGIGDIWAWEDGENITFKRWDGVAWIDSSSNKRPAKYHGFLSLPPTSDLVIGDIYLNAADRTVYVYTGRVAPNTWVTRTFDSPELAALVAKEEQARVDGDSAFAYQLQSVSALAYQNAAIVEVERTARASADEAFAQQLTTIGASVDANTAAIQVEQTARADADTAMAEQITTLLAQTAANSAVIQNEQFVRASADGALAQSVETLQVDVAGITGSLEAGGYVKADELGVLSAKYTVKTDLNGYVTGFGLSSEVDPGKKNLLLYSEEMWRTTGTGEWDYNAAVVRSWWSAAQSTAIDPPEAGVTLTLFTRLSYQPGTATLFARQQLPAGLPTPGSSSIEYRYRMSLDVYVPTQAGVNNWQFIADIGDGTSTWSAVQTKFDQWVRVSVVCTHAVGVSSQIDFDLAFNGTYVDTGGYFYATKAQMCPDGNPMNYIKTTTAAQEVAGSAASAFGVRADTFWIASPSGPGIEPKVPFIVKTTSWLAPDGVTWVDPGVYMDHAFIANANITSAMIGTAVITNAKIADVSAAKLTAGTINTGDITSTSTTVVDGQSVPSFTINAQTGSATFNNATIRGTVWATNGSFSGTVYGGAATAFGTGTGLFSGDVTGTYKWRVGVPGSSRMEWDGTDVKIYNSSNTLVFSSGTGGSGVDWSAITNKPALIQAVNKLTTGNISTFIDTGAIGTAYIGDAQITNAKIGNVIQSNDFNGSFDANGNYVSAGTSGWGIGKGGFAVFHWVKVRGDVEANSINGQIIGPQHIEYNATSVQLVGNGTTNSNAIVSLYVDSYMVNRTIVLVASVSSVWNPASGWGDTVTFSIKANREYAGETTLAETTIPKAQSWPPQGDSNPYPYFPGAALVGLHTPAQTGTYYYYVTYYAADWRNIESTKIAGMFAKR